MLSLFLNFLPKSIHFKIEQKILLLFNFKLKNLIKLTKKINLIFKGAKMSKIFFHIFTLFDF